MARRLGLTEQVHAVDVDLESTSLLEIGADVLQVTVGGASRLHGVAVFELRLPPGANVTLIVRGGEGFVPAPHTTIRHGDRLLVVATSKVRSRTEKRIRAVSRDGRLAGVETVEGCRHDEQGREREGDGGVPVQLPPVGALAQQEHPGDDEEEGDDDRDHGCWQTCTFKGGGRRVRGRTVGRP